MTIVVFKMIALVFQRIERLVCNLPPCAATPHEMNNVALVHSSIRYPTEVLDLGIANLPVLDDLDAYVRMRCIEGHVIAQPKAMDKTRSAVVPLIIGHTPGVLCRLHLLEQRGMIAFFNPEDIMQPVVVEGRDGGGIGTQTVFGDNEREVRVVLA